MEVSAKLRGARISAQKVRLVADQVRGKPVGEALTVLEFSTKKAAQIIRKYDIREAPIVIIFPAFEFL